MDRISVLVLPVGMVGVLLISFTALSLSHPSGDAIYILKRSRDTDNSNAIIFKAAADHEGDVHGTGNGDGGVHNMHMTSNDAALNDAHPNVILSSFYRDVTRRLSDLETRVDEHTARNRLLNERVEDSEKRERKFTALVEKLEKILHVDYDGDDDNDHDDDDASQEFRDADDLDSGIEMNDLDGRIETLSQYLGNREAELIAYNPDQVKPMRPSSVDKLKEHLSDEAKETLGLLERSLLQLSDKTRSLEEDFVKIQTKISIIGAGSTAIDDGEAFHNTSASITPDVGAGRTTVMPARASSTSSYRIASPAGTPLAGEGEVGASSKKVAFSAASTKPQMGTATAQTIAFDDVMENSGDGFIASNHTFVCPVAGWYFFTFSLRTADDKYLGVLLMKNEEYLVSMYTDASDRNTMETQSTIVELQAGDAVWLRLGPSATYGLYSDTYRYSTFSGFLLFKT